MKLSEVDKAKRDRERREIGQRIRGTRKQSNLKITVFSEMVGASANHISMIESGKRAPSKELLKKIAEVTNTSYSWLKNGPKAKNNLSTQEGSINPDPQLLLVLLRREHPELFPDTVQTILNITPDTLNSILEGTAEYEPQWRHALCSLAQRMDLATVRKTIHDFDAFLEEMRLPSELQRIRTAIKEYLGKIGAGDYKLRTEQTYSGRSEICDGVLIDLHTMIFAQNSGEQWCFKYVDVVASSEDNLLEYDELEQNEIMDEIKAGIRRTIIAQLSYMQATGIERLSLAFRDPKWYDRFCECTDGFEIEAELNGHVCNNAGALTCILIDDKGQVTNNTTIYGTDGNA